MAKKRRRRRTKLLTKAINVGILALAFSRPIELALLGRFNDIATEATGGITAGTAFNKDLVIRFYGPMLGAFVLKKAISMIRKTARV